MKIAVGSGNPTKIDAVRDAADRLFDEVEVVPCQVESGVSEMPSSWEEAREGASNRAENCFGQDNYDYAIGLEGYIVDTEEGMFLGDWCTIKKDTGEEGHGEGGMVQIPEKAAEQIRQGEELGEVIDEITGSEDIATTKGTVGVLTNDIIQRTDAHHRSVILAFTPFLQTDLYGGVER